MNAARRDEDALLLTPGLPLGPGRSLAGRAPLRRATATLVAIVLVATVLAAAGGAIALDLLSSRGAAAATTKLPPGPFGLAEDIPASFGVVAVEHVERLQGLGAKPLAGVTHGIQNLVPPGKEQIQASVTLTNLTGAPVAYSPTQFTLLRGADKKPVDKLQSSLNPSTLQPDASIDGRLSFVVPADGKHLWLRFNDPGRPNPILIDLGRTSKTPASVLELERRQAHNHTPR
jgi:hypothetical protein